MMLWDTWNYTRLKVTETTGAHFYLALESGTGPSKAVLDVSGDLRMLGSLHRPALPQQSCAPPRRKADQECLPSQASPFIWKGSHSQKPLEDFSHLTGQQCAMGTQLQRKLGKWEHVNSAVKRGQHGCQEDIQLWHIQRPLRAEYVPPPPSYVEALSVDVIVLGVSPSWDD